MSDADLLAFGLSLKLALLCCVLLIPLVSPLAWWLSRRQHMGKQLVLAISFLPLILPPTVLGFYLLLLLGPHGPLHMLGLNSVLFSFEGLLIASLIYSLPFALQPLLSSFSMIEPHYIQAAQNLRAKPWQIFSRVIFPFSRRAYLLAALLVFTHTLGEFGVVLMIGGNIPGQTQVVSVAIFEKVENLQYASAHVMSLTLVVLSLLGLLLLQRLKHARPAL
ncbi:MAG: molybdate ABC transporter permease subunit [Oceanospirillaceae bacterium]|nr:molybdate ABC transporter permease subunit [Oceanospirillaceae bacterium]MCP5349772.1 molybdate ABC transporter permease subunit [Oceanospirillaceae bacterium]